MRVAIFLAVFCIYFAAATAFPNLLLWKAPKCDHKKKEHVVIHKKPSCEKKHPIIDPKPSCGKKYPTKHDDGGDGPSTKGWGKTYSESGKNGDARAGAGGFGDSYSGPDGDYASAGGKSDSSTDGDARSGGTGVGTANAGGGGGDDWGDDYKKGGDTEGWGATNTESGKYGTAAATGEGEGKSWSGPGGKVSQAHGSASSSTSGGGRASSVGVGRA